MYRTNIRRKIRLLQPAKADKPCGATNTKLKKPVQSASPANNINKNFNCVNYFVAETINYRVIKHKWKWYKCHEVFTHFHIVPIIALLTFVIWQQQTPTWVFSLCSTSLLHTFLLSLTRPRSPLTTLLFLSFDVHCTCVSVPNFSFI